jgi:hypothetical protein
MKTSSVTGRRDHMTNPFRTALALLAAWPLAGLAQAQASSTGAQPAPAVAAAQPSAGRSAAPLAEVQASDAGRAAPPAMNGQEAAKAAAPEGGAPGASAPPWQRSAKEPVLDEPVEAASKGRCGG